MNDSNNVSIQSLLQYALPLGSTLVIGSPETLVTYAVTVRAQPPAFPEIDGGEVALVSMDLLRTYDSRITLAEVIRALGGVGVLAVAVNGQIRPADVDAATASNLVLISLPDDSNLSRVERTINSFVLNQRAQMAQRAIEIQRQLSRLAAENRDFNSLLSTISRATAKPVVVHDDAGVLMAQVYPNPLRRPTSGGRSLMQSLPFGAFQNWLARELPNTEGTIISSPLGFTTVLKVEKRVAGYLTLVDGHEQIDEFDRLVLLYGADVCAIELAKSRAIASAVEQARGDWVQMWLSGTPTDSTLMATRAHQSGFEPEADYILVVFRALTPSGSVMPLESFVSLVRDDMLRRQVNGATGYYVDMIIALYPIDSTNDLGRLRRVIEEMRQQISSRASSAKVASGISRPTIGLNGMREAYREAKDAVSIAQEIGDTDTSTFYGDLKLFQFLLSLKENSMTPMKNFYEEILSALVEHDNRKQGDLIHTLEAFFQANCNLAKAATDLNVHRNTLVYRLERISEMTGMDLDDPDNRLILHLALKVQRVLSAIFR